MEVDVVTRENYRSGKLDNGKVEEILTNSDFHNHGIMVRLDSGKVGRVKNISWDVKNDSDMKETKMDVQPKTIKLEEDATGYSYENLFYEYIKDAKKIKIYDAYIRKDYQIKNLVAFCSLVKNKGVSIELFTSHDSDREIIQKQEYKLKELKRSLEDLGIQFNFSFSDSLHDRAIETDTGWRIVLGRGLDFYKDPGTYYSPAQFEQTLRKCKETSIDFIKVN